MEITLNNRTEHFDADKLSIRDLIQLKNFSFKMLVVKINGTLVRKPDYENTFVTEGDRVAIIHLISGG